MWLLILEALLALGLFVFIIWWVMFSGRKRGERAPPRDNNEGD
jgi:cbb3-type cytochrome oxidase subunit 3